MERLLNHFIPKNYNLDLIIDKSQKLLTGTATITGTAKSPTIKLHSKNLKISQVKINQQPVPYAQETPDTIIIQQPATSTNQNTTITIKITYTHKLNQNMQGAYLSTYQHQGKTETIVTTQFESHYARECFPCIDEPAAKATFDLQITADPQDTVISNMPVKSQQNGTTIFETSPKMSTYLLAFVIGKFKKHQQTTQNNIKVTTYAPLTQPLENLKFATGVAVKSLDFYDNLFKTPYPLPKLDQIAIPDFEAGAMENWGLVTYREQALIANNNSALDQKLLVATVIAHELSHQWFGNLVTMAWWDDLWLNESFASLMETYAIDKIAPQLDPWQDFYSGTIIPALRRDSLPGVQAVKCNVKNPADIATLFDGAIVYAKGARLMLMLMRLMGENNFFAGLADYFAKHKYQNTTSDDLWDALTPHANFDIKQFMTPWLTQPGFPSINNDKQHRFLIAQNSKKEPNYTYPIPKIKDDLSGHYLINLSSTEFTKKLRSFKSLKTEQKLRLLFDRELLARTPEVKSATLVPLLQKFPKETDYIIWDTLSLIISDLKVLFTPNSQEEQLLKSFVKKLTKNQYTRLKLTAKPNEPSSDTKLRPLILSLMSYSEDPDFQSAIINQFGQTNLKDFDPNTRPALISSLTKQNANQPFNSQFSAKNLLKNYQTSPDPELRSDLLTALAAIKNPEITKNFPTYLKNNTIRAGDRIMFFVRLLRNSTVTEKTQSWLYQNWDWLEQQEGDKTISDYPRYTANIIRTKKDAENFKNFFTPKQANPALTRTLKIAFAEIKTRLNLIKTDAPAAKKALQNSISLSPFTSPPQSGTIPKV